MYRRAAAQPHSRVMSKPKGFLHEAWKDPWGRTLIIAATVAMVSWAVRETAVITWPVITALQSILAPLALGFTLAYVLTPAVDALQRRGMNRRSATTILFVVMTIISLLVMSIVVPAIVSQTTDIVQRSVDDAYYYDENGNGYFDQGEMNVLNFSNDDESYFYHDANSNRRYDATEHKFPGSLMASASAPIGVVRVPSLFQRSSRFIDEYQENIDVWIDAEPDDQALTFIWHYMQETQALRDALIAGLELKSDVPTWNSSLSTVLVNSQSLILKDWHRAWPGTDSATILQAQQALEGQGLTTADVRLWRHSINRLGLALYLKHQALLESWRVLKSARDVTTEASRALQASLSADIDDSQRSAALQYLDNLRQRRGDAAHAFIAAISSSDRVQSEGLMQGIIASVDGVLQEQMDRLPELAAESASNLIANISTVLMFGLNILLIPIYAFFLTLAMPTIRATAKAYIPIKGHDRTLRIIQKIEKAVAAFFRGRLIVCVICAILTWIGFLILGIPYAVLFGVLIGLATAIPLAGLVFLVPAILLTIVEGGDNVALRVSLAIAVYGAIQALEATVFTPTIMGKEVELHPVLLIVALMLCGSLLGVLGLILAVPIAATVRIFAREFFLPRIREAAGVPSTMMMRKTDSGDFTDYMSERSPEENVSSEGAHDEHDLSDFDHVDAPAPEENK